MNRFDFNQIASVAAAIVVTLTSTTMLFAATTVSVLPIA
jgi:hypothetical protein